MSRLKIVVDAGQLSSVVLLTSGSRDYRYIHVVEKNPNLYSVVGLF